MVKTILTYNIDVLILVGYRVKSDRGTKFRRKWTKKLSGFLLKRFIVNENRLIESNECFDDFKKDVKNILNSLISNNFNI